MLVSLRIEKSIARRYICDDFCESMNFNEVLMRQAYLAMKELDPYHVTIGAIDCG
jgi:hypothetical protein